MGVEIADRVEHLKKQAAALACLRNRQFEGKLLFKNDGDTASHVLIGDYHEFPMCDIDVQGSRVKYTFRDHSGTKCRGETILYENNCEFTRLIDHHDNLFHLPYIMPIFVDITWDDLYILTPVDKNYYSRYHISPYISYDSRNEGFSSYYFKPTELLQWVYQTYMYCAEGGVYGKLIERSDEFAFFLNYNCIIGSRFIGRMPGPPNPKNV